MKNVTPAGSIKQSKINCNAPAVKKWIAAILSLVFSVAGISLLVALFMTTDGKYPVFLFYMIPVVAYYQWRFMCLSERRVQFFSLLFCFLFILAQIIGRRCEADIGGGYDKGTTLGGILQWAMMNGCALLLSGAAAWLVASLFQHLKKRASAQAEEQRDLHKPSRFAHTQSKISDRWWFLIYMGLILLCWIPVHLAYYPGFLEYDSGYQLWQSWNHVYNASNPLFHTFILGWFYLTFEQLGSATIGIAAFCFCQMLLVSAALGYSLLILRRYRCPKWLRIILLMFYGLFPVFPMMAISCTKDVPFYAVMLIQLCLSFELCRNPEAAGKLHNWVFLGILTLLFSLLRANAIMGFLLIAPAANLFVKNNKLRLRLVTAMTVGVLVAVMVNNTMISTTKADRPLKRESLSIPIIQLARVQKYHEDALAELEERPYISTPLAYLPQLVDNAKWGVDITDETQGDFYKLWAQLFIRYPRDYVDAALLLNKGYWSLSDTSYAFIYGHGEGTRAGVILSNCAHGIETVHEYSFIPELQKCYEDLFSTNLYLDYPILRVLMSPALYFWLLIFSLIGSFYLRRWDLSTCAWQGVILSLALLAGPCCIVRYALLLYMVAPVTLAMLLAPIAPPGENHGPVIIPMIKSMIHHKVSRQ